MFPRRAVGPLGPLGAIFSDTLAIFRKRATQAEMEAATVTDAVVTPGRAQYHPGVAKAWGFFTISGGAIAASTMYNATVAYTAAGRFTVTITTDFSGASYAIIATARHNARAQCRVETGTQAAGSFELRVADGGGTLIDPDAVSVVCFGDQ